MVLGGEEHLEHVVDASERQRVEVRQHPDHVGLRLQRVEYIVRAAEGGGVGLGVGGREGRRGGWGKCGQGGSGGKEMFGGC